MKHHRKRMAVLLAGLMLPALLLAAEPPRKAMRSFDQVHVAWANAMRWGEMEEREPFLRALAAAQPDDFQRRRWEQVRISGYRERSRTLQADGRLRVRAEISVINVHTQAERSVVVDEYWAWLPELRSWKLDSGLPDLWAER